MYRVLIILIILFLGCKKESSSNIQDSEIETSILDRELKDSIIVSNNIFEISYNEIFEQPISSNAKYKTAAVTPDPQVVII